MMRELLRGTRGPETPLAEEPYDTDEADGLVDGPLGSLLLAVNAWSRALNRLRE